MNEINFILILMGGILIGGINWNLGDIISILMTGLILGISVNIINSLTENQY
jgi:hypothetical protein